MKDLINLSIPTSRATSGMIHFGSDGSNAGPRLNAMMYSPLNATPRKMSRTEIVAILDEAIAVVTDGPLHRQSVESPTNDSCEARSKQ